MARRSRPLVLTFIAMAALAAWRGGQVLLLVDRPLRDFVEGGRQDGLDQFFLHATRLGDTAVFIGLILVAAVATWHRSRTVAWTLVAAGVAKFSVEAVLKLAVGRDRPSTAQLLESDGYAFPSGHVIAVVVLWGVLPLVLTTFGVRRPLVRAVTTAAAVPVLAVAASRVYLGVHWGTDVVGGFLVGGLLLLGLDAELRARSRRSAKATVPETTGTEEDSPNPRPSVPVRVPAGVP